MVIDLYSDGGPDTPLVRWEDGSCEAVPSEDLHLVQESAMSVAQKLVEQVLAGSSPKAALRRALIEQPVSPQVQGSPGAFPTVCPPQAESPNYLYKTSFDEGGLAPHDHICTLDDQGNGETDLTMDSKHAVVRFQVQPDAGDGHLHQLDQGVNHEVSTSQDGETSGFHAGLLDPTRGSY